MKWIPSLFCALIFSFVNLAEARQHKIPSTPNEDSTPVTDDSLNVGPSELPELYKEEDYDTVMGLDEYYHQLLEYRKAEALFKSREARKNQIDQKIREKEIRSERPKSVVVEVDQSSQRMNVVVNKRLRFAGWKVSTGKPGLGTTPNGSFRPFEMNKNYHSRRFKVILPNGIKFQGGNLIHAASTGGINYLGQKRSHGCVRLHPQHAKELFDLVKVAGLDNTLVVVHD